MSKVALITGATSGIGLATAQAFAEAGIDLILCGRRQKRLKAAQEELSKKVQVHTLSFDVRNQHEVIEALNSLSGNWRNIDILVNSAGNAYGLAPIQDGNTADWDAMIDGNVKGLLYVSKIVIQEMVRRQSGHIVNLSSVAGKLTYANGAVYCASKKAVEAISEGMRLTLHNMGLRLPILPLGPLKRSFRWYGLMGMPSAPKRYTRALNL